MKNLLVVALLCGTILSASALRTSDITVAQSSTSVNWYTQGKVTVAKNQYACNASYAFALASNIESVWAMAGGDLKNLSTQELISCAGVGCTETAGSLRAATSWILNKNGGKLDTADTIPFTSFHGNVPLCNTQNGIVGASINSASPLTGNTEAGIAAYIASNGPVVAYIDATGLQSGYSSGIWSGCPSTPNPNHAVLLVGFNNGSSTGNYWVAKNSWGESWGEDGFFNLPYGSDACGITSAVSTVVTNGGTLPPTPNPIGTRTPAPPVPPPTPMPPSPPVPTNSPDGHHTYSPGSSTKYTAYICSDHNCNECYEKHLYPGECGYANGWSFKAWCDGNGQGVSQGSQNINANLYSEDKCQGHYDVKKSFSDYCFSADGSGNNSSTSLNIPFGTHLKIKCPRN